MLCSFKGKTTGRKPKKKAALVETCYCQCKENEGHRKCTQQSSICAFVKPSNKSDDISKIQSMLGNLDISSEVGEGNPKNSSPHKDAKQRQSGPKVTKKQPKLTFNYVYSKVSQSTENRVQQINQKSVAETNMESSLKLKRETHTTHTLNGDKCIGVNPCNKFLNSEGCVHVSSVKDVELVNEKPPFQERERKGILEEYGSLDVEDEIMDMSSIIENIVHGHNNGSAPQS
jgi:hypothetical protein